ncbi:13784_t:CDS:2, partial [Rhizophagus irregularis]
MLDKTQAKFKFVLELPFGLQNLGNTGYMNSTLQCLRVIPELQESLNRFTSGSSVADKLTISLRDLYNNLNQATESVVPLHFLQQDAEECWTQIISILKQANIPIPSQHSSDGEKVSSSTEESFIDHYMTGEFTSTLKCLEAPEEGEIVIKENFTKLNCHISILVNYVQHGIMMGLDEKIEKNSPTLRRMAIYDKTTRISQLPSYLTVQFVRFFWKSDRRVKSKILHKVKFPMELDATDFCTDELKNKILPLKNRLQELEKERKGTQFAVNNNVQDTVTDSKNNEIVEEIKKLIDPELNKDIGANVSGLYELCAVLTHIGRSAESGNYIGWVRKENSEDWIQYDDDKVSIVSQEDILKLDGG